MNSARKVIRRLYFKNLIHGLRIIGPALPYFMYKMIGRVHNHIHPFLAFLLSLLNSSLYYLPFPCKTTRKDYACKRELIQIQGEIS